MQWQGVVTDVICYSAQISACEYRAKPERALELAVYNHNRRLMHEDIGVIRLQRYG